MNSFTLQSPMLLIYHILLRPSFKKIICCHLTHNFPGNVFNTIFTDLLKTLTRGPEGPEVLT